MILQSFLVLTWMRDIMKLLQHVTLWNDTKEMWGPFEFVLPSPTLMWSTPLDLPMRCGGRMNQHSNEWHKERKKNKKVTLHRFTHGTMWGCGLTSWVVCINDKFYDIREKNMTIRCEIWTTNIRSLGFQDIRDWVTLWRLILRGLGCTGYFLKPSHW
jgi:hypothetical protein